MVDRRPSGGKPQVLGADDRGAARGPQQPLRGAHRHGQAEPLARGGPVRAGRHDRHDDRGRPRRGLTRVNHFALPFPCGILVKINSGTGG